MQPDDTQAIKAAKHLLRMTAKHVAAFKEGAHRVEGTVKQKVLYVDSEQEQGDPACAGACGIQAGNPGAMNPFPCVQ